VSGPPGVVGWQISDETFLVDCPHCGDVHAHGMSGLGHRVSDCYPKAPGNPGYTVMRVELGQPPSRRRDP
jgi:hypothetical protein